MSPSSQGLTLQAIAELTGAELQGDAHIMVHGVASLKTAHPGQLAFLSNPAYQPLLETTQATAVILPAELAAQCPVAVLAVPNPHLAFAQVAALFAPALPAQRGIHPSATVSPTAHIAEDVWIGPNCVIEAEAVIEPGAWIGPHCVIGPDVHIGQYAQLVAQVTLCRSVRLGHRVVLHPGVVIGADGFGLANDAGRWVKVPQLGAVRIGDDVEIGANTTVDRGALDDTVLEAGVKLDNQIQVGHNVQIGAHTAIAGGVMIGGSTRIGQYCMIGGGSCISGHLEIADRVVITGMTGVSKSITQAGMYSSALTAEPTLTWNRIRSRLRRIEDVVRRIGILEKTVHGDKA
jgi:UDP-3-O-[3-hydroxymyristoyl] glucosamine N-acyltransferase